MFRRLLAGASLVALTAFAPGMYTPVLAARVSDFGSDVRPIPNGQPKKLGAVRYGATAATSAANPKPDWCSYSATGNVACIQTATAVASAIGERVYASGGYSSGQALASPTISGGTAVSTDTSSAQETASGATASLTPAIRHAQGYNALDFGAKCDGQSDDAAAINAALAAAGSKSQGGVVHLPTNATCRFGATLSVPANVELTGFGMHSSILEPTSPTFSPQIKATGSYVALRNFQLISGASAIGYPSSGSVSVMLSGTAAAFMNVVDNVWIDGPCIGVDMAGNNNSVRTSYINFVTGGAGCYGIRVGHLTTQAATTDPRILDTTIAADQSATGRPDADLEVEDAGGLYVVNGDFLYARRGTTIKPSANQYVTWLFAINTALGDTTGAGGLLIDTADATAKIKGLQLSASWTSNGNGPGVEIDNTAGGIVAGVHFRGHRAYTNAKDGFDVAASVTDFSLESSHLCGNNGTYSGVYLNPGVKKFRIANNTIAQACDGQVSNSQTGINLGGTNDEGVVTGNDMTGIGTPIAVSSPLTNANLIIKDNIPTSTQLLSVPDSAAIALTGAYEGYGISTSGTTVQDMTYAWSGRHVTLYSANALTFATGGSTGSAMCNSFTSTANVPIDAHYYGCWYLK